MFLTTFPWLNFFVGVARPPALPNAQDGPSPDTLDAQDASFVLGSIIAVQRRAQSTLYHRRPLSLLPRFRRSFLCLISGDSSSVVLTVPFS